MNNRILLEIKAEPLQGNRFQPTGFPDLGVAEYIRGDGTRSLLVDSHQSVANHLETPIMLDHTMENFVDVLKGLSKVNVKNSDGKQITNTVREGHRLASPYVLGGTTKPTLVANEFNKLDGKTKIITDKKKISETVLKYDANSLIHGIWLSRIGGGKIKIPRALSAYIEADGVSPAYSGGQKWDHVKPSSDKPKTKNAENEDSSTKPSKNSSGGYGPRPFQTMNHYTAKSITLYFNLDLEQIRCYGLSKEQTELLETLALWKIRKMLDAPYRPRTFCDLKFHEPENADTVIPKTKELESRLKKSIAGCDLGETDVEYIE